MIQTKRNIDLKIALQPQADEFFNNIRHERTFRPQTPMDHLKAV
jgi:hypothetical protein